MNDLHRFMQASPAVNFRYYVQPSDPLSIISALNADNATVTYPMMMQGRLDGENAVKSGEGFYFEKMTEYYESP